MRLGGDDGEGVHRSMAERHAWVAELHAIDAPVSGSSAPALQCTPDGCRAIARRSPRADRGGPRGGGLRRLRRPRHQRLPIVQSRQRPWSSLRIGRRVALKGAQRYRQHALRDARSAVPERREVESAGARGTARVGKRGRCSLAAPRSSYTPATRQLHASLGRPTLGGLVRGCSRYRRSAPLSPGCPQHHHRRAEHHDRHEATKRSQRQ